MSDSMYDGIAGLVGGTYVIQGSNITITTDTGQVIMAHGDGADRVAENLGIRQWSSGGRGTFAIAEQIWNKLARGSFR